MSEKIINIQCKGAGTIELDDMQEFQGKLKKITRENLDKLKKRIKKSFDAPIHIWQKPDGERKILDGHQRKKALLELRKEGWTIPPLPFDFIYAENEKDARQKLLGITSQYGEFELEELGEWMAELDADIAGTLRLADIELKIEFDNNKEESTICKSDREKREEIEVDENEKNIEIHEWIDSFENILCMFSGGKDSMALFADLLEHGIDKNKITLVFNITPLDYPDLKNFVIDFAKQNNVKLEIIGDEKTENEKTEMFERNGFPLPYMSWCTGTWKVQPLNKFIKEKCFDKDKYILCQGWRREESEFRASAKDKVIHGVHKIKMARPILDYTEDQVFSIIKKYGWKLHRAYNYYKRLGCIYCFSKTREEWNLMRENDPETFLYALGFVADGMVSKNISIEYGFNAIRKMMGKPTISEREKKLKKI